MAEQTTKKGSTTKTEPPKKTEAKDLKKEGEKLKEEMDSLVDEIDEVLEENCEEFVKAYVQRGGE
jgi:ubiquitin-like protein Pup